MFQVKTFFRTLRQTNYAAMYWFFLADKEHQYTDIDHYDIPKQTLGGDIGCISICLNCMYVTEAFIVVP